MAECGVCGKSGNDTALYEGIHDGKIQKICYSCSLNENITLIKKPTREQLEEADKRKSVRELMEKLSEPHRKTVAKDSAIAHKNLAKLNFPKVKQEHADLIENYDWTLKNARRHKKLSVTQVSEMTGIDKAQIESLENGQIFLGFENVAWKLEDFYKTRIMKIRREQIIIKTPEDLAREEEDLVKDVKGKMKKEGFFSRIFKKKEKEVEYEPVENIEVEYDEDFEVSKEPVFVENIKKEKEEEKKQYKEKMQEKIEKGEVDFSRRKDLDKLTIQDLAEMKKRRERD